MAEVEGATPIEQNIQKYIGVTNIVLTEEQNTLKNKVSLAKLKIDLLERILRDKKNATKITQENLTQYERDLNTLLRTITELFAESERPAAAPARVTEPAREEEIIEIEEAPTQEEEEEPEAAEPAVPEERYRFPRDEMLTYRHKIEVLKQIIKQLKTHLGSRGKISVREIDEKLDGLRKAFKDLRPRNWLGFDKIPEPVDEINALKDSITQDVLGENEEAAGKVLFLRAELRRQLNFIPNEKRETFKEETNFEKVSQKARDLEGDVRAYIEKLDAEIDRLDKQERERVARDAEEARRAQEERERQAEEERVAREAAQNLETTRTNEQGILTNITTEPTAPAKYETIINLTIPAEDNPLLTHNPLITQDDSNRIDEEVNNLFTEDVEDITIRNFTIPRDETFPFENKEMGNIDLDFLKNRAKQTKKIIFILTSLNNRITEEKNKKVSWFNPKYWTKDQRDIRNSIDNLTDLKDEFKAALTHMNVFITQFLTPIKPGGTNPSPNLLRLLQQINRNITTALE